MRSFFPVIVSVIAIILLGLFEVIFLRFLTPDWWKHKYIKIAAYGLPIFGMIMVIVWAIGQFYQIKWLLYPGAILAVATFILEICLMLSIPIAGILHFINWIGDKFSSKFSSEKQTKFDSNRRIFLKGSAAALPLITITTGVSGFARAFSGVNVFEKKLKIVNLPDDLDGLKIFHLSDLHLSHYVNLDDLAEVLQQGKIFSPDLILVTGDIADKLDLLPDTLRMFGDFKAPLGTFASLGNHEHFRGLSEVKRIFDRSQIPLLVNDSVSTKVGKTSLFIGGIDDPVRMGAKENAFFERTIDKTLQKSSNDEFKILMSHRPDALDFSSKVGINLVLSGHTHGGQMGINGRSMFENVWPDRYLWGEYFIGKTTLYTSSGVGHWFPFRLGCPPEAPIITLSKS